MPVQLKGSCHCRRVKFELESNTPVPYQCARHASATRATPVVLSGEEEVTRGNGPALARPALGLAAIESERHAQGDSARSADTQMCQCSICRKIGGYMGSVNIMGNADTLRIVRGKDDIAEYQPPLAFDGNDKPTKTATSARSFCTHCAAVLWNAHPEWPRWVYPSASAIDSDLPPVPQGKGYTILRASCPGYVPTPAGFKVYDDYGPGEGIEAWHRQNGEWVD